jgi:energy-coupling factor transporter ATP-binding protein EcfA2
MLSDLHGQVQVILLLGAAGSGKTNFVKLMSGSNIHVEHGLMNGMFFSCKVKEFAPISHTQIKGPRSHIAC